MDEGIREKVECLCAGERTRPSHPHEIRHTRQFFNTCLFSKVFKNLDDRRGKGKDKVVKRRTFCV